MPTLVRTHRAVFALVGVAVVAILAVSGWLLVSAHARPQPRPAHVAAVPSALPSAAAICPVNTRFRR